MKDFFIRIWNNIKTFFFNLFHPGEKQPYNPPEVELSDNIVCYYGCPNSNKAKKLQTSRKLYR